MFELIMILYVLPMVVVAITHYAEEETRTIGDFLKFWFMIFIPFLNLFIFCVLPLYYISNFLKGRYNLGKMWENLMNKKIKRNK